MSKQQEALRLALEALEKGVCVDPEDSHRAIYAIREALAQPPVPEAHKQEPAAEYIGECNDGSLVQLYDDVKKGTKFYTSPPAQPQQEPVHHAVIAGALFDFMGWLTSRKERLVLSSADNASPAVEAITEFANMRGLSLDDAKVQDWNTAPPAQPQQEPFGYLWPTGMHPEFRFTQQKRDGVDGMPLYTSPPARKPWVGLTDDDREAAMDGTYDRWDIAEAIEAKLREKNT